MKKQYPISQKVSPRDLSIPKQLIIDKGLLPREKFKIENNQMFILGPSANSKPQIVGGDYKTIENRSKKQMVMQK